MPGAGSDDLSHRVQFQYNGDRYGVEIERLGVGDDFTPDVGFLARDDYQRSYASARFSPRPNGGAIRKYTYTGAYELYEDGAGRMETRNVSALFSGELHNGDLFGGRADRRYEFLERPFAIAPGVSVAPGGYPFTEVQAAYTLGPKRKVSGRLAVEGGTFYGGDRTSVSVTSGRVQLSPKLSLEPGATVNWVTLPTGAFTSTLLSNRATFTFTPALFVSGLVQYNSGARTVGSNIRLRWEYQPGSELFVVYTDELDARERGYPDLRNRAFVVKVNRLFRF
jgi:hypothetical protein